MEIEVSFRIFHPYINPGEITEKLKLTPTRFWVVGEPRKTPQGLDLHGINKESFWNIKIDYDEPKFLSEILGGFLSKIMAQSHFFENICSSGGRCEFYIGIMPSSNIFEDSLKHDLLKTIADLHIDLILNFYK